MGLADDLKTEVASIFRTQWNVRDGRVVPDVDSLPLKNEAIKLDATVLYADLVESTAMVDNQPWEKATEVYKTYLHCASKIIRSEDGEITAFDGDRVMAVFVGDSKNTQAVRTALKLHWVVQQIINPALKAQYGPASYQVRHVAGVDTGVIRAAKTGVRNANDIVWVGPPANYAAKLCTIREEGYPTWITVDVYATIHQDLKISNGQPMWEARTWGKMPGKTIYRSRYWWYF